MKILFEVNSTSECQTSNHGLSTSEGTVNAIKILSAQNLILSPESLASVIHSWRPKNPSAKRRILVNEIVTFLEEKNFNCVRACIPAIIVNNNSAIDLMHYQSDKDISEFMVRILWMRQEFDFVIGIFIGITDDKIATEVQEDYEALPTDEDCMVLLM